MDTRCCTALMVDCLAFDLLLNDLSAEVPVNESPLWLENLQNSCLETLLMPLDWSAVRSAWWEIAWILTFCLDRMEVCPPA